MSVHLVRVAKYRYHVLQGAIWQRPRDLMIQICNRENVQIVKGVVGNDHVHVHLEYAPLVSVSNLVKKLELHVFFKSNYLI